MTDKWTDRLSEYVDGELPHEETEALEAHLLECLDCGRAVHELRAVVARAAQVIDRPPETDLWPEIAARMAAAPMEGRDPATNRRRVSFSIPQLAAASVVLMLLSAGTMYMMLNREQPSALASTEAPAAAASQQAVTTDKALATRVRVESPAAENYDVAITDLELALTTGRAGLDTATVRVLETNLRVIDNAIAEARSALGGDPGNPYLNRYLDQAMQRKIQLLRRATGVLRAQT